MKTNIILKIAFFLVIFFASLQSEAQIDLDKSGTPIITQEFVDKLYDRPFEYIEEGEIELAEVKDKIIIIDFWQTWCKPCLQGFAGLQKAKSEWPDKIEILAASPDMSDSKSKIMKFIKKNDYEFQYIWAKDLSKELQLRAIPFKIIIAPGGQLIGSKTGFTSVEDEYKYIKSLISKYY